MHSIQIILYTILYTILIISCITIAIFAYQVLPVHTIRIPDETFAWIEHYFSTFNETDKRLRNGLTLEKYIKSLRFPNKAEYEYLKTITDKIDSDYPSLAKKVPWKFIVFRGDVENKYPHTHGSFIFLHQDNLLNIGYVTLFHEKIHVFQRYFPWETNTLLISLGYSIHGIADKSGRSNPDINSIIYLDEKGNTIDNTYIDDPKSLLDIKDRRDHPFEIMAYDISTGTANTVTANWVLENFV